MRDEAINVVEAARKLCLQRAPGGGLLIGTAPETFRQALLNLLVTIEAFDNETSKATGLAEFKPSDSGYAHDATDADTSVQQPVVGEELVEEVTTLEFGGPVLKPSPRFLAGEAKKQELRENDETANRSNELVVAEQAGRTVRAIRNSAKKLNEAVLQLEDLAKTTKLTPELSLAIGQSLDRIANKHDAPHLGLTDFRCDTAFADSDADLDEAIDSLSDCLAFAVSKTGWTPRLRSIAFALRLAMERGGSHLRDDMENLAHEAKSAPPPAPTPF
ncbi:hypothetical protein ACFOY8_12810 [Thalassospira xianhensis]|uniref:Uncharacterized protein n=1 Tax=Thalassospira xianhensis MCCC 1A02616 TaxID=1177929 RepID=A0A367UG33_9PROT|nr:hypothetical protein [Thalassospira xianhensis]RCK06274.1 hypothetical protein TH5_08620 [Thalassospira xianhensis MCCC 1A02616]